MDDIENPYAYEREEWRDAVDQDDWDYDEGPEEDWDDLDDWRDEDDYDE